MTIDERIERLTERHEALTQSVELIVRTTQDNARQINALREASANLLQIVQIHENRISGLEGGK